MNYSLINAIQLLGSIGLFVYGMKIMSEGIQKVTGSTLRSFLSYFSNNKYVGLLTGFSITALIQSSSAATVMIVSFVNAGLISLKQSFGLILGANIGTTITTWLINTLGFIDLDIITFALPIIGIGVPLLYSGSKKGKPWGEFLVGFGLLFLGLNSMKYSVPIVETVSVEFLAFLQAYTSSWFSIPLFILLGIVLTVILQSSSTAIGITLVIVVQGWLPINAAMALILGENVGTTVTAFLASLVGNTGAKRAAIIHILFNTIGLLWAFACLPWLIDLVDYLNIHLLKSKYSVKSTNLYHRGDALAGALTIFHSLFNVINALLLIHLRQPIINLSKKIIPDKKGKKEKVNIPFNQYIETHEMSIMQIQKNISEMFKSCYKLFSQFGSFHSEKEKITPKTFEKIDRHQQHLNNIQITFSSFINELSQKNSSQGTANLIINSIQLKQEIQNLNYFFIRLIDIEKQAYSSITTKKKNEEVNHIIININFILGSLSKIENKNRQHLLSDLLGKTRNINNNINELKHKSTLKISTFELERIHILQIYCTKIESCILLYMNLKT